VVTAVVVPTARPRLHPLLLKLRQLRLPLPHRHRQ
jgi:hypothetical protein